MGTTETRSRIPRHARRCPALSLVCGREQVAGFGPRVGPKGRAMPAANPKPFVQGSGRVPAPNPEP
eukprot:365029-Chlamydomonas_euryale.AAC.18